MSDREFWNRVPDVMKRHRKRMDAKAQKDADEIWDAVFGSPSGTDMFGDVNRKPKIAKLKRHKSYDGLSDETVGILGELGK